MRDFIRVLGASVLVSAAMACSKEAPPAPDKATPTALPSPVAVVTQVPTTVAAPSALPTQASTTLALAPSTAAPTASTAAPQASASVSATNATAVATATASASSAPVPVKLVSTRASGDNFTVDLVAPAVCAIGETCGARVILHAAAPFHINDEYPYKFNMDDSAMLESLGTGLVFSKKDGHFKKTSATEAEIAISVRGKAAGAAKIAGEFRMSVCAESKCQVEAPKLSLAVTVK